MLNIYANPYPQYLNNKSYTTKRNDTGAKAYLEILSFELAYNPYDLAESDRLNSGIFLSFMLTDITSASAHETSLVTLSLVTQSDKIRYNAFKKEIIGSVGAEDPGKLKGMWRLKKPNVYEFKLFYEFVGSGSVLEIMPIFATKKGASTLRNKYVDTRYISYPFFDKIFSVGTQGNFISETVLADTYKDWTINTLNPKKTFASLFWNASGTINYSGNYTSIDVALSSEGQITGLSGGKYVEEGTELSLFFWNQNCTIASLQASDWDSMLTTGENKFYLKKGTSTRFYKGDILKVRRYRGVWCQIN